MNVGRRCTLISCKSPEDDVKFKDKYGQNKFFAWGLFTMFAVGCYLIVIGSNPNMYNTVQPQLNVKLNKIKHRYRAA